MPTKRPNGIVWRVPDQERDRLKELCWEHRTNLQQMVTDAVKEFWDNRLAASGEGGKAVRCPKCRTAFSISSGVVTGLSAPEEFVLMVVPKVVQKWVADLIRVLTEPRMSPEAQNLATAAISYALILPQADEK